MRIFQFSAGAAAVTMAALTAPVASASAQSFCGDLGGDWGGQYCPT
ncbi:mannan-binding lectin, partial [Mycobacterium avium]